MLLSDAVTHPVLSFLHPEWLYKLSTRPEQTVATRRALLGRAADDRTTVTASHLPFPSVGRVSRGEDLFRLTPTSILSRAQCRLGRAPRRHYVVSQTEHELPGDAG